MKKLYLFCFTILSFQLSSQLCSPITAGESHMHGKLKANLLKSGEVYNQLFYKTGIGEDGSLESRTYAPLLYSENVWVGGTTRAQSIKLAAGYYNKQDWVAGTLNEYGIASDEGCSFYDQVFTVTKGEIKKAIEVIEKGLPCKEIPLSILNWPARSNPNLDPSLVEESRVYFYDANQDGIYDPCEGDLPHYSYYNVEPNFPCDLSLYIMNDQGSGSPVSKSNTIQMELEVYTYSFDIPNLEGVIFTSYKFLNKATEDLIDAYFSIWSDFDLGCKENDYIGGDSENKMYYAYNNGDENCGNNSITKENIMVGISVLSTPLGPFIFKNINGVDTVVQPPTGTGVADTLMPSNLNSIYIPVGCEQFPSSSFNCLPDSYVGFYNNMRGLHVDGDPVIDHLGDTTRFSFNDSPDDPIGNSMCNESVLPHTSAVSSFGPLMLQPGRAYELTKVTVVENGTNPECPSIESLRYKVKKAKDFYNNWFYHPEGPASPTLRFETNNQELIMRIQDIPFGYKESIQYHPLTTNAFYNFEGIKIYQVKSENFDMTELENDQLSYLVYQGDVENTISDISNWEAKFDGDSVSYIESLKVVGENKGIKSLIKFDYDYLNNKPFDPNQIYYFVAVSYAHTHFIDGDPNEPNGEQFSYLETSCCKSVVKSTDDYVSNSQDQWLDNHEFVYHSNQFTISEVNYPYQVELIGLQGVQLASWQGVKNEILYSEDLSYLPNGMYIIHIKTADFKVKSYKIFIVN